MIKFTTLAICLLMAAACSNENRNIADDKIPASVTASFDKKYPGVKPDWDKEGSRYEAKFETGNDRRVAIFSSTGAWVNTLVEIEDSAMPALVLESIKRDYPRHTHTDSYRIDNADANISYEARLKEDGDVSFITYNIDGIETSKRTDTSR